MKKMKNKNKIKSTINDLDTEGRRSKEGSWKEERRKEQEEETEKREDDRSKESGGGIEDMG